MHAAPADTRRTILITHANPEDNAVARWLAARLAAAGYRMWVDLRSLKGGQDFWDEIEIQLRQHAIKQIVLISAHTRKRGVMKELALGDAMGKQLGDPDFMIPVRVSPVPHSDFPPELLRRNAIEATPHWSECLAPLLDTFEAASIARNTSIQSDLIGNIVHAQEAGRLAVVTTPEKLVSNWFGICEPRPVLRLYGSKGTAGQLEAWLDTVDLPFIRHSGLVGTLCDPETFAASGAKGPTLEERFYLPFDSLVRGRSDTPFVDRTDARRNLTNLLRQHWNLASARRGLQRFEFAAGKVGWFFPDGLLNGPVKAEIADTLKVNRVLSGKFKDRRWHLCLIATPRLWPDPIFRVHANIALTEDGRTPLPGDATHKLRRRLTRSWWNDKWRDLLLAGMHTLSDGNPMLSIAAGTETFSIASRPQTAVIDVSYDAEEGRVSEEDEAGEIELSEDLDEEGDGDLGATEEGGDE